jgi:hypothetical protein
MASLSLVQLPPVDRPLSQLWLPKVITICTQKESNNEEKSQHTTLFKFRIRVTLFFTECSKL